MSEDHFWYWYSCLTFYALWHEEFFFISAFEIEKNKHYGVLINNRQTIVMKVIYNSLE